MNEPGSRPEKAPDELPLWAERLLLRLAPFRNRDVVVGDFAEIYQYIAAREGRRRALRWYWGQVVKSLPAFFSNSLYYGGDMLRNYLKISLRHLRRQKGYAFINIVGLAIGLAFCALISLYVRDELTYDQFHAQGDRIYRALSVKINPDGSERRSGSNLSVPLGPALQADLPEVEHYTRFRTWSHVVRSTGEALEEPVLYADPSIFEVFSFPLVQGNPTTVLADLNAVVLSKDAALKFFGEDNPIGETLQIRIEQTYEDFIVTGVAENVPGNSTIRFDILLPFPKLFDSFAQYPTFPTSWNFSSVQTYVMLADNTTVEGVEAKLTAFYNKYHPEDVEDREEAPENHVQATYRLEPLTDIHLTSVSAPIYSYILSGIALAILLIACINFMTLSIGRSASRSREVGVRKVMGAQRVQLMGQFWGEAVLLSFLGLLLGLVLAEFFLPVFNDLAGKELRFDYAENWTTGAMLVGLVLFTGLVAGSYPALVLSSARPIETLKNRLRLRGSNPFTKSLVVIQFALAVFLIISTLVMAHQFDYARTKNLGFNKEQIVILPIPGMDGLQVATRFRNVLGNHAGIVDITATSNTLGNSDTDGVRYDYEGKTYTINLYKVEANHLDFLGLDLLQGRNFDPNLITDSTRSVIVNEALVRDFALTDPIGHPVPGYSGGLGNEPIIIGVVKDYQFQSFYKEIAPMMLTLDPAWDYEYLLVRITPGDIDGGKLSRREFLGVRLAEYMAGDPNFIADAFYEELKAEFSREEIVVLVFACSVFNFGNKFNTTMRLD
ncbi:MAG: ABC transporter permease, partial [Bacteroidetes bacterium]|nr:ABC transporter permease [Bacteroidota bacterium]